MLNTYISMRVFLPNLSHTLFFNIYFVKMMKYITYIDTYIIYLSYVYYW